MRLHQRAYDRFSKKAEGCNVLIIAIIPVLPGKLEQEIQITLKIVPSHPLSWYLRWEMLSGPGPVNWS